MPPTQPPRRPWPTLLAALTGLALIAATCPQEEAEEPAPGPATPTPTPGVETGTWELPNLDLSNTRNAQDSRIAADTIDRLEEAWTFDIPGAGPYGAAASNPIVVDGTVYFQDLASNVFAIDLVSGESRWEVRNETPVVGPNGPVVDDERVYAHNSADSVAAYDRETGEEVWETELDGPTGAHQPVVYDGTVYTGTQAGAVAEDVGEQEVAVRGYAGGSTGYAYALNAEDGSVEWRFQVVEEGFWGNPDVNSGGGLWMPPAIDTETGMTFWGTGNPAPFPGTVDHPNAESRPGSNPHTNSMIALDGETGELEWANEVNPWDLFDHDFHIGPILTTAEVDGEQRDIAIGAGKLGRVIAFERENGDILWDTEVGEHQNDDLREIPEGETVTVLPGTLGGVETPMALADGVVYAPVVNLPTDFSADGHGAEDGTEAVQNAENQTHYDEASGELVAIDVATGDILWESEVDDAPFGGATVVNDVVIVPIFDGTVHAFDRESGEEVWTYEAGSGIIAWPAVAGDTLLIAAGTEDPQRLIALRLDGDGQPTPGPEDSPSPGPSPTPAEATPGEEAGDAERY